MSLDFRIAFECPHLTIEERATLDTDRRTLLTSQGVVPSSLARVFANKAIEIPRAGLYSLASLTSFARGPYKTDSCNRDFVVDSAAGTLVFTLPQGTGIKAADLVQLFQPSTNALIFRDANGALQIDDVLTSDAKNSFIRVSGKGADALGFVQKQSIGSEVFPPFGFVRLGGTDRTTRIQFASPVRQSVDLYATYTVNPNQCLRCAATRVENDYRFDDVGLAQTVQNENLLNQAALKILLTEIGSNPYHPWYGTTISQRIGSKAVGAVASAISAEVQRVLLKMRSLQLAQSQYQVVTPEERLYTIDQINVTPSDLDLTIYNLSVSARNASNRPVDINVIFTIPSVLATINKDRTTTIQL